MSRMYLNVVERVTPAPQTSTVKSYVFSHGKVQAKFRYDRLQISP